MMTHTYDVTIDFDIGAPVHGKNIIYGMKIINREDLSIVMVTAKFTGKEGLKIKFQLTYQQKQEMSVFPDNCK